MRTILIVFVSLFLCYTPVYGQNISCSMKYPTGGDFFNFGWTSTNTEAEKTGVSALHATSTSKIIIYSTNKKIKSLKLKCSAGGVTLSASAVRHLNSMTADKGTCKITDNIINGEGDVSLDWTADSVGEDYVVFTGGGCYIQSLNIQFSDEVISSKKQSILGDIDGNGDIDVTDVTSLINLILNK